MKTFKRNLDVDQRRKDQGGAVGTQEMRRAEGTCVQLQAITSPTLATSQKIKERQLSAQKQQGRRRNASFAPAASSCRLSCSPKDAALGRLCA